jgi:hypothetical protein
MPSRKKIDLVQVVVLVLMILRGAAAFVAPRRAYCALSLLTPATTTQRWMSSDVDEKTDKEKDAVKAAREARK